MPRFNPVIILSLINHVFIRPQYELFVHKGAGDLRRYPPVCQDFFSRIFPPCAKRRYQTRSDLLTIPLTSQKISPNFSAVNEHKFCANFHPLGLGRRASPSPSSVLGRAFLRAGPAPEGGGVRASSSDSSCVPASSLFGSQRRDTPPKVAQ